MIYRDWLVLRAPNNPEFARWEATYGNELYKYGSTLADVRSQIRQWWDEIAAETVEGRDE